MEIQDLDLIWINHLFLLILTKEINNENDVITPLNYTFPTLPIPLWWSAFEFQIHPKSLVELHLFRYIWLCQDVSSRYFFAR